MKLRRVFLAPLPCLSPFLLQGVLAGLLEWLFSARSSCLLFVLLEVSYKEELLWAVRGQEGETVSLVFPLLQPPYLFDMDSRNSK